jgi:NodT family efflux transporter outer membrane factor (OMF) lipoprotein
MQKTDNAAGQKFLDCMSCSSFADIATERGAVFVRHCWRGIDMQPGLYEPRKKPHCLTAGLAVAVLSLSGCTGPLEYIHNGFKVGPNYKRPPAPVAEHWIDANDVRVRSEEADDSHWWTVFNDPTLNDLVQTAYRQNLTVREAGFRVLQARAQLAIAIGEIFPQTQVMDGDYTRRGVSENVANRVATPKRWFSTWNYSFGLAWEVDLWGRFRRAIEAADDILDASVENYDDVLVTLIGDVAATYVQIRTLQQQITYARQTLDLQRQSLQIARAKFKGGQTSEVDVNQAQSDVATTEALIEQLLIPLRQATNRLCILLGLPPEDLLRKLGDMPIPLPPPEVVIGVPADLLRRRPDVRRAERLAAAQCAEIGVAEADFYPHISLNTTFGWSAEHLKDLFAHNSFRGSVGPSFEWAILNYGRILNNVRLQDARFQELVVHYQNIVLQAGQEVEDGLVTFLRAQLRARDAREAVNAEMAAFKEALAQYRGGLVDFNRVVLIQERLVERQQTLAEAQGQIGQGLIQVYRALGGGWQIRCEQPVTVLPASSPPPTPAPIPLETLPTPEPASDKPAAKAQAQSELWHTVATLPR